VVQPADALTRRRLNACSMKASAFTRRFARALDLGVKQRSGAMDASEGLETPVNASISPRRAFS